MRWILLLVYALINFYLLDKIFEPWGDEIFFTEPSLNADFTTETYPPMFKTIGNLYGKGWLYINRMIFKAFGYNLLTIRLQSLIFGLGVLILLTLLTNSVWPSIFCGTSYFFIRGLHCGRPEMAITFWLILSIYLIQRRFYRMAGFGAGMALFWHIPSGVTALCIASGYLTFFLALPES